MAKFFDYLCIVNMRATPVVKEIIGLFFEGLMLLFVVAYCISGYNSNTAQRYTHKEVSLRASSIEQIVMHEATPGLSLEQHSSKKVDYPLGICFVKLSFLFSPDLSSHLY